MVIKILKTIVPKYIKTRYRENDIELFNHCMVINVYDKVKLSIFIEFNSIRFNCIPKTKKIKKPN